MRARQPGGRPGYTLFEAAIVLSLLGFFLYLSSGSLLSLIPKYKLESALWDIRSMLNAARYKAVFDGTSIRVRIGSGQWEMERYDSVRHTWVTCRTRSIEGVRVEANNTPVFTAQGTMGSLATITLANSWGSYKITLALTGRTKTTRLN